jgi:hypothetical protein
MAAGVALSLHYTAALIVAPLCIRIALNRWFALRERVTFVAVCAAVQVAFIPILTGFGARLALGRYAAVAVPMLIVAIAMAAAALPRPAAVPLVLAAITVSALGLIDSHRASGFYADARGVVRYVESRRHANDAVLTPASPGITLPLQYYADRQAAPPPPIAEFGSAEAATFLAHRRRLWIVSDLSGLHVSLNTLFQYEQRLARGIRYRSLKPRIFGSVVPSAVALWVPRR